MPLCFCAGLQQVHGHAQLLLRRRGKIILAATDGSFEADGREPIVPVVLDGLLLLASEAIAELTLSDSVSVRTKMKVLGWLVADVMGQKPPWAPAVALTVGKRLDKRISSLIGMIADGLTTYAEAMCVRCPTSLPELELKKAEQTAAHVDPATTVAPAAAPASCSTRSGSRYEGQPRLPPLLSSFVGPIVTACMYEHYHRDPVSGLPTRGRSDSAEDEKVGWALTGTEAGAALGWALKRFAQREKADPILEQMRIADQELERITREAREAMQERATMQSKLLQLERDKAVLQAEDLTDQVSVLSHALARETARADALESELRAYESD